MSTLNPVADFPIAYPGGRNGAQQLFFDARQTLLTQYANSPVLLSLIDDLNDAIDRQIDIDAFYDAVWSIDSAAGFGLDIWGRIVGVRRALYLASGDYLGFSQSSDAKTFGSGIFYGGGSLTPNYQLSDDTYRRVILAKAALNISNSSIASINAVMLALFPGYGNVYVRDNNDMTMTFVFGATLSKVDYAIVTQSGVLPKPIGVSFSVEQP